MIQRSLYVITGVMLSCFTNAQQLPWTISIEKKTGTLFKVTAVADLEKGWYLYGETATSTGIDAVRLQFDSEVVQPAGALIFNQTAKGFKDPLFDNQVVHIYQGRVRLTQDIRVVNEKIQQVSVNVNGFASNGEVFQPFEQKQLIPILATGEALQASLKIKNINLAIPKNDCGDSSDSKHKSLITIFLLGFSGGLIALLTPCVFPMIPITVSFFTSRAGDRRQAAIVQALLYGACIAGIYLLLSLPFHFAGGVNPGIFNVISTSIWLNLLFFLIFLVFALSFFGLFDIRLPAGWANATSKGSGVLFMALTLVIVSFSCTGPILGSLLVGSLSADGGAWQLTAGMGGFGLALALPFTLFALFPEWLKQLPKSGAWMDTVKKTLAFVELALALKFLSNADMVAHWGLLKREIFVGAWIVITICLGIYLLRLLEKEPTATQNSNGRTLRPRYTARYGLGLLAIAFALYMTEGLVNNRTLRLLSGFPPPVSYSLFEHGGSRKTLEPVVINDYKQALALSKKTGKPLLIDFTGWACVNCRKMEELVWTDPRIKEMIEDRFILVSLYVDDRKTLPAEKRFVYTDSSGTQHAINTVGEKWSTFQSVNFNQVSQPLYVIMDSNEQLLNHPVGYTPDVKAYTEWLECGLRNDEGISFR